MLAELKERAKGRQPKARASPKGYGIVNVKYDG